MGPWGTVIKCLMFRYELVNSTRKFTIVAEIVSLLKKIYKRDVSVKAVFKVKTLAVLFSLYPREMKHIPQKLNLPPLWRLLVSIEMVHSIPTRALSRARGLSMRTHLTTGEVPSQPLIQNGGRIVDYVIVSVVTLDCLFGDKR